MNLKDAFAGLGEPESQRTQAPKRLSAREPERTPAPLPLQGTAKSRHPEFEPVKVYLRKNTRKAAARQWEDATGDDFSDLVQHLLEEYLRGKL